jgi:hypothetical protein
VVDRFAVAHDPRLEQRALLALELARQDHRHERLHVGCGDVGDEAEPPVVDADQRRLVRRELAADAEHRAVAAEHHRDVRARADFRRRERRIARDADLARGIGLEHDVEAEFRDAASERGERLGDAGRVAPADERNSIELITGFHAGITP